MTILFILLLVIFLAVAYRTDNYFREESVSSFLQYSSAVLIDVRTLDEWETGHHPASIHIPIDRLVFDLEKIVPDKNRPIVFCCKRGIRSHGAMIIAKKLGYSRVFFTGTCTKIL